MTKEEKAIQKIKYLKNDAVDFGLENKYVEEAVEAFDIAIDTIRKYQKIADIINRYDVTWEYHHMKPTIDEIRKVIEADKS